MAEALGAAAGPAACGVVVPVFNAFEATRRCLESIARHTPAGHRVVLVDDASTDARIAPLLREFAQRRSDVVVLENARNLGFPQAANRGLREAGSDVVLLQSDTEVTAGWLEGLARCRASHPAIGIVSPLSNRAAFLSLEGVSELYRRLDQSIDIDALGECVRLASRRDYVRLPTAVGFCMLLTRALLDATGGFDPVFGRGYGEDNDLAMRALDLGFEIACCDDVYVHHAGEASFGAVAGMEAGREMNRVRLERRWPAYSTGVAAWWRTNALRPALERVNAQAEAERLPGRPRVLVVIDRIDPAGGIEPNTRALLQELKDEVAFTVVSPLPPQGAWPDLFVERPEPHLRMARMSFELGVPGVEAAFAQLLAGRYDVVHFQSLPAWESPRLPRLASEAGARVVVDANDTLLEARSTGAADAIAAADAITCASAFAVARVKRAFGDALSVHVISLGVADMPVIYTGERRTMLRVAYLGRVTQPKGGALLIEAARRLAGQRVMFEAWGAVDESLAGAASAAGILLRGVNANVDLGQMLREIDLVVVPMVLAESSSPVVSVAQQLGIPVAASAIGAIPEQVRDGETGFLFPAGDVGALVTLLLRVRDDARALDAIAANLREHRQKTHAACAREYLALYREGSGARAALPVTAPDTAAIVRHRFGHPRNRHNTALGDDAYDRWLDRAQVQTAANEPLAPLATIELPAAAPLDENDAVRALNRRIHEARAEWIVLHQEGDRLASGALEVLGAACSAHPRAALIHCDHDATSVRGDRYDPLAKPRFSPELLRHAPYIAGLCAVHRERLLAAGGLRASGWIGIVDYALRLAEGQDPLAVVALPQMLVSRLDLNLRALEDPASVSRLREVVAQHLRRMGSRAQFVPASAAAPGMWAHREASGGRVSAMLRASAAPQLATAAIDMLLSRSNGRLATIFIDIPAAQWGEFGNRLAAYGHRDARAVPAGGAGLSAAIMSARTEWIAIVDARCERLDPGWLERLEEGVTGPYCAAIAPDLVARDGTRLRGWEVRGGGPWGIAGAAPGASGAQGELLDLPREVSIVSDRLALVRRDPVFAVGALRDLERAGRFAMAHLCLALGASGHECVARPFIAGAYGGNAEPGPASSSPLPEDVAWMRERWRAQLGVDPYLRPGLTESHS